ncbi:hypothetical protein [Mycetocola tolaasinivorans]|uniref:hypothetical protein n=1 Tax=Mycetocola tolaasinivorans TaxID=76635 RepID=UPI00160035FC|nr:hypothetical protein [Mycetocola tolaasinivorans]
MNTHPTSPRHDAESSGRPAEPNEHELADAFDEGDNDHERRVGEPERDDDDLTSLDAPD